MYYLASALAVTAQFSALKYPKSQRPAKVLVGLHFPSAKPILAYLENFQFHNTMRPQP